MFAQVVIESPLPQLDRVFEYEVPKAMQPDVVVGARVLVTVGRSKKPLLGYIVGLMDAPEFQGKTAAISELVTAAPVLNAEIYSLCQQLSLRHAAPLGETLRLAIPTRSVGVEKQYLAEESKDVQAPSRVGSAELQAVLLSARSTFEVAHTPLWVQSIADQAIRDVVDGSVIVCMPDAHDLALLRAEFNRRETDFIDYSSGQTPSKRYGAFLAAHDASRSIILGNRSALFAPVRDLNSILIWNELDFSHIDQGSPYLNSREIALVRQSMVGCHLRFLSLSLSCDIERLVQLEFLELRDEAQLRPKIAYESSSREGTSLVAKTIKSGLATGPVLVQVSAIGHSVAVYCETCQSKVHCNQCAGPLWLDASGKPRCRWCNAFNYDAKCNSCGATKMRQGRGGSTRSVAELGKAYPGIRVIESTSENRVEKVGVKPMIVVATPGCEPLPEAGYAAVILIDAASQLAHDSLRSVEDAVASWAEACALLSSAGSAVLLGVGGKLAEQFVLWNQRNIAAEQLLERVELQLPPAIRLGSITGQSVAAEQVAEIALAHGAEVLGPTELPHDQRQYIMKYPYRLGSKLAGELKSGLLKVGAGRNIRTNRNERLVRVKMDDRQVV